MQLDRIEITGFRGIRRLSLTLDMLSVLIGENAWGKSSLLDALCLCFSPSGEFYQFKRNDFYIDHTAGNTKTNQIQIIFCWRESAAGEANARRYRQFKHLWVQESSNPAPLLYVAFNAVDADKKIITTRNFLDSNGNLIEDDNTDTLIQHLISLHPILRMQDARRLRDSALDCSELPIEHSRLEKRLNNTVNRLHQSPGHVTKAEIKSGLQAMRTLLDHYFAFNQHNRAPVAIEPDRHLNMHCRYLHPFELIAKQTSNHSRMILMGLLTAFLRAKGPKQLKINARPIIIFEDPESRLHPTLLSQAWRLISLMPMQKILTTNSGDLLSAVPLTSIRRLERQATHTKMYNVLHGYFSADQLRRVTFHVRFHRPSALFARCWLLVEGETEIWLFNELARLQGYDLAAEGVQLIEFAQSGLKPLIKLANCLGIQWHVITDGDMAGQHYAETTKRMLEHDKQTHRLTVLPNKDIEHFLFHHGYDALFRQMANIAINQKTPTHKIITAALKHYTKPNAALAIIEYAEQHCIEIPLLLRRVLQRVISMARGAG